MLPVLALIKNNKTIATVLSSVALVGVLWFAWHNIETSIYNEGYNDAVTAQQKRFEEAQNEYRAELVRKLKEQKDELKRQQEIEIERITSEKEVDTKVETVTKFIEKEVYVKEDCDIVPDNLNSLLNETIRSINRPKQGR